MKITEFLIERAVVSSWIVDLRYARKQRIVTMTLSNGRAYTIVGVSRYLVDRWVASQSKGKFFHQNIRGKFRILRLR